MSFLINNAAQTDIWSEKLSIPIPAMDIVIFTVYMWELCVVLLKHELDGKNSYILPGWIISAWFNLEENFDNILKRKTGISWVYKEQLYTFWEPNRDKRWHTLSLSYIAIVRSEVILKQADLTRVAIVKYNDLNENNTGFRKENVWGDHLDITRYAKQRLIWKFEYTNVAKWILDESFRMSQLQDLYEIIFPNKTFDKRNFQKRIIKLGLLEETGELDRTTNRPAKLYRFKDEDIQFYQVM